MKIEKVSNVRVVVYVNFSASDVGLQMRQAREVIRQIQRHVNDVQQALVVTEREAICSHCGNTWDVWTESDLDDLALLGVVAGMPACCKAAQDEFKEARK